ncbi:MAG TPA: VanZ family protein, partial [Longimicrobium sp.]|nr:VanZ family protein [Longimicrobium sp.]
GGRAALLAGALGSLYGVSDELHQLLVRNRSSDPVDWMADTLGVLAGVALWHLVLHHSARRASRRAATDVRAAATNP